MSVCDFCPSSHVGPNDNDRIMVILTSELLPCGLIPLFGRIIFVFANDNGCVHIYFWFLCRLYYLRYSFWLHFMLAKNKTRFQDNWNTDCYLKLVFSLLYQI